MSLDGRLALVTGGIGKFATLPLARDRADVCGNKYGRIVNMTSVAGVLGGEGQTSHGAAKAGLIALAKSTTLEGARYNITANCVLVGV